MKLKQLLVAFCAGLGVAAAGGAAVLSQPVETPPSLVIFEGEGFGGTSWTITRDIANLDSIGANDSARSIRVQGRWEICMDAGYVTDCRIVDADVTDLGEHNGSMSSARYLGPDRRMTNRTSTAPAIAGRPAQPGQTPSLPVRRSSVLPNTDLPGNDYRSFDLARGQTVATCQAACEGDNRCVAWTFVVPGSTDHGICYLKDRVPEAGPGECCTSGVIGA